MQDFFFFSIKNETVNLERDAQMSVSDARVRSVLTMMYEIAQKIQSRGGGQTLLLRSDEV